MKKISLIFLAAVIWLFIFMVAVDIVTLAIGKAAALNLAVPFMCWIWACIYNRLRLGEKPSTRKIVGYMVASAFIPLGTEALAWLTVSVEAVITGSEHLVAVLQINAAIIAVAGSVSYLIRIMIKKFKINQALILATRGHPSL